MRTDCIIDRKRVRCPNATPIGYGQTTARVGDWVTYELDLGSLRVGRMIGRVHYAPDTGAGSPELRRTGIKNWLCVATLSTDLTSLSEQWVHPVWVRHVHRNTPDVARFLTWVASPELLLDGDPHKVRRLLDYGAARANLQPDEPSWDVTERIKGFEEHEARQAKALKGK
jgi:hypothetical protein